MGSRFLQDFTADPEKIERLSTKELLEPVLDSSSFENEEFDLIVVGSGMSGLTSAALAAQLGKKVLVLEADEKIGGFCHTFEKEGFTFCPGMHAVFPEWPFWGILQLATERRVKFAPLASSDGTMETIHLRRSDGNCDTIAVPVGGHKWMTKLTELFPEYKSEITTFFRHGSRVPAEYDYLMLLRYVIPPCLRGVVSWLLSCFLCVNIITDATTTIAPYLDSHFPKSPLLRFLLGRASVLCGYPDTAPVWLVKAIAYLSSQGRCIGGPGQPPSGTVYPVGGAEAVICALAKTILKYGGSIVVNARVEEILVQDDQDGEEKAAIRGVFFRHSNIASRVRSPMVVTTCGIVNTRKLLPPRVLPSAEVERLFRPSMFFVHTFLGFDVSAEELGLPESGCITLYLGKEGEDFEKDPRVDMLAIDKDSPFGARSAAVYSPHSVHANVIDGKKVAAVQLMIATGSPHFERWKELRLDCRGSEYIDLKESVAEPYLEFLFDQYPAMRDHLVLRMTATRLSTIHWTSWPQGEIYGVQNSPERIYELWDKCLLPTMENVRGLTISGVDSMLAASVSDAVLSGAIALMDIVPGVDLFAELPESMMETIRKSVGEPFVTKEELRKLQESESKSAGRRRED